MSSATISVSLSVCRPFALVSSGAASRPSADRVPQRARSAQRTAVRWV